VFSLWSTQSALKLVPGRISQKVKWPKCETD
jgi:hypothetical protein